MKSLNNEKWQELALKLISRRIRKLVNIKLPRLKYRGGVLCILDKMSEYKHQFESLWAWVYNLGESFKILSSGFHSG